MPDLDLGFCLVPYLSIAWPCNLEITTCFYTMLQMPVAHFPAKSDSVNQHQPASTTGNHSQHARPCNSENTPLLPTALETCPAKSHLNQLQRSFGFMPIARTSEHNSPAQPDLAMLITTWFYHQHIANATGGISQPSQTQQINTAKQVPPCLPWQPFPACQTWWFR